MEKKRKRNGNINNKKKAKENKSPKESPIGYVHDRARRGQATDNHRLAERVTNSLSLSFPRFTSIF